MITSWSPSRYEKYQQCPRRAKYDILDRLCSACFKGKLMGGYDCPEVCDTCGVEIPVPAPIARGNDLDGQLQKFVEGKGKWPLEIRHHVVHGMAKELRAGFKAKQVLAQLSVVLDKNWNPVDQYTKGAWFRGKLDVWRFVAPDQGEVIDWKSGGIDKRTGAVRAEEKYDDQLSIYATVSLCVFPEIEKVSASLVFVDAGPRFDPVVRRPSCDLARADLPAAKKGWEKKLKAMMSDKVFAPRPGDKCRWCAFAKGKGGPCVY